MIGLYVKYRRYDSALAALELADHLRVSGQSVSIFTPTPNPAALRPEWDRHVCKQTDIRLARWVKEKKIETLVWFCPPSGGAAEYQDLEIASEWCKKQGVSTIFVYDWSRDGEHRIRQLKSVSAVVVPCQAALAAFKSLHRLNTGLHIPWAPPVPQQRHSQGLPDNPRLLVPITFSQLEFAEGYVFETIEKIVERHPAAAITVLHQKLSGDSERAMRHLRNASPNIVCKPYQTYNDQLLEYAAHDLLLMTAHYEVFGLAAIQALRVSMPVVAYDIPPVSEFVGHGRDGMLVPAELIDHSSISIAVPDPKAFADTTCRILEDRELFERLRSGCGHDYSSKATMFTDRWKAILTKDTKK